jgi:hypothetical protein
VTRTIPDFAALLGVLSRRDVAFLVVGGVGAALQGAPISTFDLDIVHARDPENVTRLLGALQELEARYRARPDLDRGPDVSHLVSPGHQLLMTRFGPLDLLGAIGRGEGYAELRPHTVELELGTGLRVRVLDLETLIRIKDELGREKDRAVLPILRRTLLERKKRNR